VDAGFLRTEAAMLKDIIRHCRISLTAEIPKVLILETKNYVEKPSVGK
jgi:hypothetical protein